MRREIKYIILLIAAIGVAAGSVKAETRFSEGNVCKANCRANEGVICLERGPCEPINEFLLKAAKECRENPAARYMPITKLLFVDTLSQIMRLDKEYTENIDLLTDEERYNFKAGLLKNKGIDVFIGTKPLSPLTRDELAAVLKNIPVEKDLGLSNGLPGQMFDLKNEKFVVYDLELYVDEGRGFELWERKASLEESLPDSRQYVAKLDSCDDAMVVFGDSAKGRIPDTGARIKAVYKYFGRNDEIVTECEVAMLLSNPDVAESLKNKYNPSRSLTKANFADLLIKTMQLSKYLPRDFYNLSGYELYKLQTEILARHNINIFIGSNPDDLLTREELARVLYDCPVEIVVGISNGERDQSFELKNAGFVIYDLHTYVDEGGGYQEWNKQDSLIESSSLSRDYLVKLDLGNYASIYFGDSKRGKIPAVNSPIKAWYRLYAPVAMLTEDDIICVLGRCVPVAEAYEPPEPPFEFPDPEDGYDDPATHI